MSGASLPTNPINQLIVCRWVLIPDEWGKSSDGIVTLYTTELQVLIPDEWGKSSDTIVLGLRKQNLF